MRSLAARALFVLPFVFASLLPQSAAATSLALTISTATAHPQVEFQGFDSNPAKLFDLDGDGRMEIVAQNDNQWAYVFDSRTGAILAELETSFPPGWQARSFNGPEAAVFDSAGTVRVILQNSAAVVTSFRLDAAGSSPSQFVFVKEWERRLDECHASPGSDSKPVLADLDRDGRYEIIAATEEQGLYALRENGDVFWKNCMGGGNAEGTVADVDLDGWLDVVFGSDGGVVTVLDGRHGWTLWSYDVLATFALHSASMPAAVAVGQLDGLSGPDIVVGVRDSHDPLDWSKDHALLLALDSSGRLLWARQDPGGNPLTYTRPVIVDAARDGQPEIYWGDWNTVGHKPPDTDAEAWARTGAAHVYRYDPQGNVVWRQTLDTYWSNKDVTLADVDGDGVQEVLVNAPGTGGDGIWSLDSRSGAFETFIPTAPWKVSRAPLAADLWGTGTMQLVIEVSGDGAAASGGGLLVYDTGMPYLAAWPHLPDATLARPAAPAPIPVLPKAEFVWQVDGLNLNVTATDGGPGATYTWTWGDDAANVTGRLASHAYASAGQFGAQLTVGNANGTRDVTHNVTMLAPVPAPNPTSTTSSSSSTTPPPGPSATATQGGPTSDDARHNIPTALPFAALVAAALIVRRRR